MINKRMEKAINEQINAELYSGYLYLSMSAYAQTKNMSGIANWLRVQAQEEQFHAMKMFDYVNERGGTIVLDMIEKPQTEWENFVDVFEEVYKHEQKVTSLINNLVDIAMEEKDHATFNFLQWYIGEQVEEEANASGLLEQLKFIDGKGSGLFMMDRELQTRVFTPPVAE
ncbi:MAG: ferritin [Peptostreptococcaceae bacterium]|nr:ferritin [Peptostreptococcaceae bacterium]